MYILHIKVITLKLQGWDELTQTKCLRATLDLGPYKHLDQIESDRTEKSSYKDKTIKP